MSDDERSSFDKLPRVLVFDGDAESYLDADEAYQRWDRRHYKGGLDKWIYGPHGVNVLYAYAALAVGLAAGIRYGR